MSSIDIGQAVILGVVEGLTEFLPVSSTGHLRAAEAALGIEYDDPAVVAFTAVIQVGAIAAVLVYFFADIVRIARAWLTGLVKAEVRGTHDHRFGWWIIAATVPIVVVGVAAKSLIDGPLASLWVVVASLVIGSAWMYAGERIGAARRRTASGVGAGAVADPSSGYQGRGEGETTFTDAMLVGTSQILALLLPGLSRSGATISTGLMRGLDRVAATRLSFFLSIPALTGAGLYELKDAVGEDTSVAPLIVGTVVSFVVAYASVAWLLRFVARHDLLAFVGYRLVLAVVLAVLIGAGALG